MTWSTRGLATMSFAAAAETIMSWQGLATTWLWAVPAMT